jgi:hypothetical protein
MNSVHLLDRTVPIFGPAGFQTGITETVVICRSWLGPNVGLLQRVGGDGLGCRALLCNFMQAASIPRYTVLAPNGNLRFGWFLQRLGGNRIPTRQRIRICQIVAILRWPAIKP